MARTPPDVETGAHVDGLPELILRDQDREQIAEALADLLWLGPSPTRRASSGR